MNSYLPVRKCLRSPAFGGFRENPTCYTEAMPDSEGGTCQNCRSDFAIGPEDLDFYSRLKVPPPTFCPPCRMQRRLTWRNERTLYRRKCDAPGHEEMLVSMYPPGLSTPVYDQNFHRGDAWEPMQYGRDYDFSRPFFEQWHDLVLSVPLAALMNINDVRSDYCNFTYESKNCYLNFASDWNEDSAYLYHSIKNKDCFDMLGAQKNEHCYALVDSEGCYESDHLVLCEGCIASAYCYDCRNSQNCVGCVGLRSAKYCVFNEQLSPEEYKKRVGEMRLDTREGREAAEKEFREFLLTRPRKFSNSRHTASSTGDYLNNVKNCTDCFDVEGPAENCRFLVYGVTDMREVYDAFAVGLVESSYEIIAAGIGMHDVAFSSVIWDSFSCRYCYFTRNSSNCFGCVSIENKQYCILNRQYSKEEYEALLPKIIDHMNTMPYIDPQGRIYKYGEFFPSNMSFFAYNETLAQEYFSLTEESAKRQGYLWKDPADKSYSPTKRLIDLPESIKEARDPITQELIECKHGGYCGQQCTKAFRILASELQLLRKLNIPLPGLCVNCRHYERLKERNPFKLYHRECMCDHQVFKNTNTHPHHPEGRCPNQFETTYAPEGKEIVYCEQCYQAEVA